MIKGAGLSVSSFNCAAALLLAISTTSGCKQRSHIEPIPVATPNAGSSAAVAAPDEPVPAGPQQFKGYTITETKLYALPAIPVGGDVSKDTKHLAFVDDTDRSKATVYFDGKLESQYDGCRERIVLFSPNSKRHAYAADKGGRCYVVENGQAGTPYESVSAWSIVFSPDSKRLAYVVNESGKFFVVDNGAPHSAFDSVDHLTFSPDSKHLAYKAKLGGKGYIVIDGRLGPRCDDLDGDSLTYMPDGKGFSYVRQKGSKCFVVIAGKQGTAFEYAEGPTFSPDGKHYAYAAQNGNKWFLVVDGKHSSTIGHAEKIVFSDNSRRLAYVAETNTWENSDNADGSDHMHDRDIPPQYSVVVDGKPGPRYELEDFVSQPVFYKNGKHVLYAAHPLRGKSFVVVDGNKGPNYDGIFGDGPSVQPDGSVLMLARRGRNVVRVKFKFAKK